MPSNFEIEFKQKLINYFESLGYQNPVENATWAIDKSGFEGRFDFIIPFIPLDCFDSILVSGSSFGTELLVAKEKGFKEILGVEVSQSLVELSNNRLSNKNSIYYEGVHLPFLNNQFSVIVSGHVIEHTLKPKDYFDEHISKIKVGGYFFLEFPSRYHSIELHTGTRSFEWLPRFLRNIILRLHESGFFKTPVDLRHNYRDIRLTLMPISIWQIRLWSFLSKRKINVVKIEIPSPGTVRILLKVR
jgi:SAM-dependent methyltransferase